MKRRFFVIGMILLALTFFTTPALAESKESIPVSELEGLSYDAQREVVKKYLDKEKSTIEDKVASLEPEEAEKWVNLISGVIKGVCQDLSIQVNEFTKSDVGKVTIAILIYKIVGEDILKSFIGVSIWALFALSVILSFRFFHMTKAVKTYNNEKKLTDIKYVRRYNWQSEDAKTDSAWAHGIAIFSSILAITAVIFV